MILKMVFCAVVMFAFQGVSAQNPAPVLPASPVHNLCDKSVEHSLNFLKCAMHIPSVLCMNTPETADGHRAIYLSQLAVLLKVLRDRTRVRTWSVDLLSDLRLLKVLAYIGYGVDCYELLKKVDDREEGAIVSMGSGEKVMQGFLLALEMVLHGLFYLNDKNFINVTALNILGGEIGLELLDLLELFRLWRKIHHHSTVTFTEVDGGLVAEEQPLDDLDEAEEFEPLEEKERALAA